jgi:TonB family protein
MTDPRTGSSPSAGSQNASSATPVERGAPHSPPKDATKTAADAVPSRTHGPGVQLLPKGNPDLIAIPSTDPDLWPAIVEALTRPPGLIYSDTAERSLADLASPDVPTAPDLQEAIASLIAPDEIGDAPAFLSGLPEASASPLVVAALLHPPGAEDAEGGSHGLGDIVTASATGSPEIHDAVVAMLPPEPAIDLALPIDERASLAQGSSPTSALVPANDLALTLNVTPAGAPAALVPIGPVGSAANASGGLRGPPVPPADLAADTGLESDPFAKIPGVQFRNGKVDARSGRQVKPVRPRLTEAARRDLLSLQFPTILLKVKIDDTGKVQDVKVLRGSGSEAVDMPVYRAMWQWWFEPPKDNQGKPQADVQLVAIHWG